MQAVIDRQRMLSLDPVGATVLAGGDCSVLMGFDRPRIRPDYPACLPTRLL